MLCFDIHGVNFGDNFIYGNTPPCDNYIYTWRTERETKLKNIFYSIQNATIIGKAHIGGEI